MSIPEDMAFTLYAPMNLSNSLRILRAMQSKKAVLLEGSPGVGKTSLIEALAKASGHRLVRINLSEQTDVVDLFGTDLPVEADDEVSESETYVAKFAWRDGPFLKAMKE